MDNIYINKLASKQIKQCSMNKENTMLLYNNKSHFYKFIN